MTAPRKKKRKKTSRAVVELRRSVAPAVPFSIGDRILLAKNGTTAALVAARRLRAIPWGKKRVRVLRTDLERIAAEGIAPDVSRPRAPRRRPPGRGVAAAILAIPIRGEP
jgi:hypothetical protein